MTTTRKILPLGIITITPGVAIRVTDNVGDTTLDGKCIQSLRLEAAGGTIYCGYSGMDTSTGEDVILSMPTTTVEVIQDLDEEMHLGDFWVDGTAGASVRITAMRRGN